MSESDDSAWVTWVIGEDIDRWNRAVQRQHDRVFAEADSDALRTDVHLYAVALHQLLLDAVWAQTHAKRHLTNEAMLKIRAALRAFRVTVPDLDKVRDVHEHLPEYMQGRGRLQKAKYGAGHVPTFSYWRTDEEVYFLDLTLNVRTSAVAAAKLADSVREALAMSDADDAEPSA